MVRRWALQNDVLGSDSIYLTWHRNQWQGLLNTVIKLRASKKAIKFFTQLEDYRFTDCFQYFELITITQHGIETHGGVETASHILNVGARWKVNCHFRPLYILGKCPQYPLNKPQSRFGSCGEETNLCPCRELNPIRPSITKTLY